MVYLWLTLVSGLLFIALDFRINKDFLSPFIWLTFINIMKFAIPGLVEADLGTCEFLPTQNCDPSLFNLPGRIVFIETFTLGASYFFAARLWSVKNLKLRLEMLNPKALWPLAIIFFVAFIDLMILWLKDPREGALYYQMAGHGWANILTFFLGIVLGLLLLSIPKYKWLGGLLLASEFFLTYIPLDRKTQMVKILLAVVIILINPFKMAKEGRYKKVFLALLPFLFGALILKLAMFYRQYPSYDWFVQNLKSFIVYNLGLFHVLVATIHYAPPDFELSPLIYSRSLPYYGFIPFFKKWALFHEVTVEQWVYGKHVSQVSGFPFLNQAQNYFTFGWSGVVFFAFLTGQIFGFVRSYMQRWYEHYEREQRSQPLQSRDFTLGVYAYFWYCYAVISLPPLQPLLQLVLLCLLLGGWKKGLRP